MRRMRSGDETSQHPLLILIWTQFVELVQKFVYESFIHKLIWETFYQPTQTVSAEIDAEIRILCFAVFALCHPTIL